MAAEAATYAERAEMGGWDEEAWYARLHRRAACSSWATRVGSFVKR